MGAPFPYESEFLTIEKINIEGIPCLKIKPKQAKGLIPTVIYYHGWGSNKENQRFKAMAFSIYGYQIIVPDGINHGERKAIDHNASGMFEEYFWNTILNSVEESSMIIENIIKNHNADPNRISVMGSSMGGFTAAGVFVHNEDLKAMVNFNGSCAWVKADEIFRQKYNRPPADKAEILKLSKYDPMENLEALKARPILMLHGDKDSSVPIDSQRVFYNKAGDVYKDKPEKLKFIEIPNMNHYISTGMLEEGISWFKQYL